MYEGHKTFKELSYDVRLQQLRPVVTILEINGDKTDRDMATVHKSVRRNPLPIKFPQPLQFLFLPLLLYLQSLRYNPLPSRCRLELISLFRSFPQAFQCL